MSAEASPDIYLSFFMFTANLQPENACYSATLIRHIREMLAEGYAGFDLPIAPRQTFDHAAEVDAYKRLKQRFVDAGLEHVAFTTNVGATRTFDPTSLYREQRQQALAYLKSRVDITQILGGSSIMAGPFLFPYGVFPVTDAGDPLWSDTLQDWLAKRYPHALSVFDALADHAEKRGVRLAIEPVDHWETPGPNTVSDVLQFCAGFASPRVGVTFDTAHIVLGSTGPDVFRDNVAIAHARHRLHYVHISPPDRGALRDSWIPWDTIMPAFVQAYRGPYLVEVFNAVPPFMNLMRLSRRKFWIPGEDRPDPLAPSAYLVARDGFEILRDQLARFASPPKPNGCRCTGIAPSGGQPDGQ